MTEKAKPKTLAQQCKEHKAVRAAKAKVLADREAQKVVDEAAKKEIKRIKANEANRRASQKRRRLREEAAKLRQAKIDAGITTDEPPELANSKKPGAGPNRNTGAKKIHNTAIDNIVERLKKFPDDKTPLEFLLDIQNNSKYTTKDRIAAANAAMPYIHTKAPKPIEVDVTNTTTIEYKLTADAALSNLNELLKINAPNVIEGSILDMEAVVEADLGN